MQCNTAVGFGHRLLTDALRSCRSMEKAAWKRYLPKLMGCCLCTQQLAYRHYMPIMRRTLLQ